MKNLCYAFIFLSFSLIAQDKYQVTIDLTQIENDKVPVEVVVPTINEEQVEYHMPKIVPGTYSISDFGRFVVDFKALDVDGNDLETKKISTNIWIIEDATKLAKITYWVEDSFDDFNGYGSNKLFEPGGMGIDKENKIFVLNMFGFVGYISGMKFSPYQLTIHHEESIKGATSLEKIEELPNSDTYTAENYNFLVDAPLLYCEPDIVNKDIAGTNVLVSVYSPNKLLSASDVMDNIDELMEAQANYLGGSLPVDRYAYLIYLFDEPTLSGSYGALEHSYSSLYTLPEMDPARISQTVRDIAAHEFFHIVTPLNIHSEEIHNFDYIKPEMSQHLWLYEGVTEYSAHHVQVKYGLYDTNRFLNEIRNKMYEQEEYNVDIPYTEFSKNILDPINEVKYGDVYSGGALIALCLDLTIIKSTNGEMNLQSVLRELSRQYGPMKPFKDGELFDEIEKITTSEVGEFLRNHVGGTVPLPFNEVFGWVGITYAQEIQSMVPTIGKFTPGVNENEQLFVASIDDMNDFGKDLGLQVDDILKYWNGEEITLSNFSDVIQNFYENAKEDDKVTVIVKREVKGKEKEKKLKAKAVLVKSTQRHSLELMKDTTDEQLALRSEWLEPSK